MKRKIISLFLALLLIVSYAFPMQALGSTQVKNDKKSQSIKNLKDLESIDYTVEKLSENEGQVFISGKLSGKLKPGKDAAISFIQKNKHLFSLENPAEELIAIETKKDNLGDTFVKLQQTIKGIKVNGCFLIIHFDKDGTIVSVNGKVEKDKKITTLGSGNISKDEAINIAKKQFTYNSLRNEPKAEKMILKKDKKNYEVYKVNIFYSDPTIGNWDVYVEAHTGKVLLIDSNIRYDGSVTGSGIDVLGYNRPLNLYSYGIYYQMRDYTKTATDSIITYSLNGGTSTGYVVQNTSSHFNSEYYKASVSAHYHASEVIDFYKEVFNRNSLDNMGMAIKSFTHYGIGYNNAFWDGYEMVYGDGDGYEFTYLSGDLDVVGHEMTHGVIEKTADLEYHNQPGALNESMADVFGVLISTYSKYNVGSGGNWTFNTADWIIADDVYTPYIPGDALRSLSNPTLYGQPDHFYNYYYLPDTEEGDWGGVHINSGIPNKAAYLVAKNIGMRKTAQIYYRALTYYMTSYTDFLQAKLILEQSASDLFGYSSQEAAAVDSAFTSVGIGLPPVDDPYEPNDDLSTAYPITPGEVYQAYISQPYDFDFYKLHIASPVTLDIKLSNLPYDYELYLLDSYGGVIENSVNSGTLDENIIYTFNYPGDYYILIYGYEGAFSAFQKYSLRADIRGGSIPVTGISLDKTSISLKRGGTSTLVATISPSNATNKNVYWSSTNDAVATVDNRGTVRAIAVGTATIIVTAEDGGYYATCAVTVIDKAGWVFENGKWYYYDPVTGLPKTGWLLDNGKWYYLRQNGEMATGWIQVNGIWYFMNSNGSMATGWVNDKGVWYYMNSNGSMATGWIQVGSKWYYLNSNGSMATGWIKYSGSWYYLYPNGSMATGWVQVGSKWYYLYSNGKMAYNTVIDGYRLGPDGAWVK